MPAQVLWTRDARCGFWQHGDVRWRLAAHWAMERGYQGTQPSENQPESDAHQAAEKRREHKCAAKEKEAAYAVSIPLLLSWFSLETADMVV